MSDPNAGSRNPILETLVVFAVVFVLQWIATLFGFALMASLFVLSPPISVNPWTVVTSVYAHGNVGHLVSNAVALVAFGWPVARATTRVRFHLFFLAAGAIAGVSQIVLTPGLAAVFAALPNALTAWLPFAIEPTGGVLGASGAVFALLGYLIASNRLSVGIASLIDVPTWLAAVVFLALAVVVTYATAQPQAAVIAHFVGFLLGLAGGRARLLDPGPRSGRNSPTASRP